MSKRQDIDKVLTTEALADLVLLQGTREKLTSRGWTTDSYICENGVCLMGAVLLAGGVLEDEVLNYEVWDENEPGSHVPLMNRVSRLLGFDSYGSAINWNDADAESQEQVLNVIDEAIEKITA